MSDDSPSRVSAKALASLISESGVQLEPGLSASEVERAEQYCGCSFPVDLRELLMAALPTGKSWPDWRNGLQAVKSSMDWPLEGICFDIERNKFWYPEWGRKPLFLKQRCKAAKKALAAAPRLIPIFSHRYMPDRPLSTGNPIYSVYQTDIIYYGRDLESYFANEFGGWTPEMFDRPMPQIEFWTDFIDYCQTGE